MRRYTRNKEDFDELYDTLSLDAYHNIEISAKKLLHQYPDLMKSYDIHDEYELHNLLRKTINREKYPDLDLSRTPMLCFGKFDRDTALVALLQELAPISKEDFIDAIAEEYGIHKPTIGSMWLKCVELYYHQGEYRIDYEPLPQEQVGPLLALLKDDFYFTDEIKELYVKNNPGADEKYISSYNLKNMGFMVYKNYVIRNTYKNAIDYFTTILTANDSFNILALNKRYGSIVEYTSTLSNLRHNYSIIEIAPYEYIRYSILEKKGITRDTLKDFCDHVAAFVSKEYFTMHSLRNSGFDFQIEGLSYSDWFYGSIVREDDRFSFQRTLPQQLLRKTTEAVSRKALINEIIDSEQEVNLTSLLSMLRNDYGMDVCKSDIELAISDSEVYYDPINDKYYATYGLYKKMR